MIDVYSACRTAEAGGTVGVAQDLPTILRDLANVYELAGKPDSSTNCRKMAESREPGGCAGPVVALPATSVLFWVSGHHRSPPRPVLWSMNPTMLRLGASCPLALNNRAWNLGHRSGDAVKARSASEAIELAERGPRNWPPTPQITGIRWAWPNTETANSKMPSPHCKSTASCTRTMRNGGIRFSLRWPTGNLGNKEEARVVRKGRPMDGSEKRQE